MQSCKLVQVYQDLETLVTIHQGAMISPPTTHPSHILPPPTVPFCLPLFIPPSFMPSHSPSLHPLPLSPSLHPLPHSLPSLIPPYTCRNGRGGFGNVVVSHGSNFSVRSTMSSTRRGEHNYTPPPSLYTSPVSQHPPHPSHTDTHTHTHTCTLAHAHTHTATHRHTHTYTYTFTLVYLHNHVL